MYRSLIASDLDGTLLFEDGRGIDPRLFGLIPRWRETGVLFCAASGRSHQSLQAQFAPVAGEIGYLCENGAEIYLGDSLLHRMSMPRDLCRALVEELAARPDCYPRVNTTRGHYLFTSDGATLQKLREVEDPDAVGARSFDQVEGEITQVTAISLGDIEPIARELIPRWSPHFGVIIAGKHWLDFTTAGKDVGLRYLCQRLGIPLERTIAFGDSYNDAAMLETAGEGYLMSAAAPELRHRFPLQVDNVVEFLLTRTGQL